MLSHARSNASYQPHAVLGIFVLIFFASLLLSFAVLLLFPRATLGLVLVLSFISTSATWWHFLGWSRTNKLRRMGLSSAFVPVLARHHFISTSRMERTAVTLPDGALIAAFHHPDHAPVAKDVLAAEIVRRGLERQIAVEYLPPSSEAMVPSFVRGRVDFETYMGRCRRRAVSCRGYRWMSFLALSPLVFIVVVLIELLPFLAGRRKAARILLLRPFGEERMTKALQKVVINKLGPLGNVFTLSDQHYKPNFLVDVTVRIVPVVARPFYPIIRYSYRIVSVRGERTFQKLACTLTRHVRLSWMTFHCGDQALNIRTSDNWWKRCVDLLMNSSDFIVMDISKVSTGSAWEIAEIAKRDLAQGVIFIVQEQYSDAGREALQRVIPDAASAPLHIYREDGQFHNASALDTAVMQALSSALTGTPAALKPRMIPSTAAPPALTIMRTVADVASAPAIGSAFAGSWSKLAAIVRGIAAASFVGLVIYFISYDFRNPSRLDVSSSNTTINSSVDDRRPSPQPTTADPLRELESRAAAGNPEAMRELGNKLIKGELGREDALKGVEWLKKAAESGNYQAFGDLAVEYESGSVLLKDNKKAAEAQLEYLRAANQVGNVTAYFFHISGMKSGMFNVEMIREMQIYLKDKGLYRGTIDGVYGNRTHAAVRSYAGITVPD